MNSIQILNETQIDNKIKRMAYEIWEKTSDEKEIIIFGIEQGGAVVANSIEKYLAKISPLKIKFHSLKVDKKNIENTQFNISEDIKNKTIIIIDDVANSGKTLLYTLKPMLDKHPKKILIAVLVDRNHKNFPINPDIKGHTVLTTLQDNVVVSCEDKRITGVFLQ